MAAESCTIVLSWGITVTNCIFSGGEPTLFIMNKVTRHTVTKQKHPRTTIKVPNSKMHTWGLVARVGYNSKKEKTKKYKNKYTQIRGESWEWYLWGAPDLDYLPNALYTLDR